jgi:hypothetical protein
MNVPMKACECMPNMIAVSADIMVQPMCNIDDIDMTFSSFVPSVFYTDISEGLRLFVDCLHFKIEHDESNSAHPYCVLGNDGLTIMLFQDKALAAAHYPELRLVTKDIEEVYATVSASHPGLLHPNLNKVTRRPWWAKEFAIKDKQVGIRFQQW